MSDEDDGMDGFDFEELFDELFSDEEEVPPTPRWRATIRRGRLSLTAWGNWLADNGPIKNLFHYRERAGVAIADLTIAGDEERELLVRFHSTGGDREAAEAAILEWATQVGYRRVWLPDRMVPLDPGEAEASTASVRCPTCLARWSETGPDFWLAVRRGGMFPKWCPLCGGEMPQWLVGPDEPKGDRKPAPRVTTRHRKATHGGG